MNVKKSDTSVPDCQPCRLVGTGLFLFVATYIWYHTRNGIYNNGFIYKKLPLRLIAIGSLYMSFARFIYLPPFKHLAPEK
ncbi:Uncharacterized protein BM_BM9062 [Brugia malayi]|uniref:Bm9062 n=1 Tax=Brugia malayi TaxID=6279 RepID=A0A0K0JXZ0_BRUMA|nr:Uncharacterized protein BM_BM9062 [Brugia malayi]CDQ05221.1 Bm9062 [Brugia malayi]VIO97671.1 Uncharacterized protein BM_BM9062 [Brugia malayi]